MQLSCSWATFSILEYFKAWENYLSGGDNNKAAIISWLADPKPEAEAKPKETEWSEEESEVRNYPI